MTTETDQAKAEAAKAAESTKAAAQSAAASAKDAAGDAAEQVKQAATDAAAKAKDMAQGAVDAAKKSLDTDGDGKVTVDEVAGKAKEGLEHLKEGFLGAVHDVAEKVERKTDK
uniref:EF-hand domain-containing protein n=1 Tax=Muribaculaceae bacterium Z82 TaxID=2304548 RepID=A0A7C9NSA9_9BACT